MVNTMQPICPFIFAYVKSRFSHVAAQIYMSCIDSFFFEWVRHTPACSYTEATWYDVARDVKF